MSESDATHRVTPPHRDDSPTRPAVPDDVARASPADRIGRYIRTRKLGAGGFGEVWQAWDTPLSRWVALKLHRGTDSDELLRFQREAQLSAGLNHPNIAAVYEVGTDAGQHFIAMQFVDGRTLKGAAADGRTIAGWIRDAARAVAFAHSRGIVHRDLKPENLMLERASGRLYVMDFGLARPVTGDGISVSGSVMGTPAYMPPEQARGDRVDARSDVYALGATLYELLSGKPPFRAATVYEVLRAVQEQDPPRLPAAPRDLETIALKCLEKDPARRYADGAELAADLQRWLDGEPIRAHPASMLYRLGKHAAKRKAILTVSLAGIAAVIAVAALFAPRLWRARQELELWARVSVVLNEAMLDDRLGQRGPSLAKIEEGLRLCREHLARGESARAHYFAARLLRLRHSTEEALRELDRAIELDPAFPEPRFERGVMHLQSYLSARIATRVGGESVEAFDRRRPELAERRRRAEADIAVSAAGTSSFFSAADRRLGEALKAWIEGDAPGARERFQSLIVDEPAYHRAYVLLGMLLNALGDYRAAVDVLDRGLALYRHNPDLYQHRAQAKIHIADERLGPLAPDALEDIDRALELGNDDSTGRLLKGNLLQVMDRFDEAIAEFERALIHEPGMPEALAGRATCRTARAEVWAAEGRVDDALQECDRAIVDVLESVRKVPRGDFLQGLSMSRFAKAEILTRAGRPSDEVRRAALADAEESVRIGPEVSASFVVRGLIRQSLLDYGGALADFHEELRRRPGSASAYHHLGELHWEMSALDSSHDILAAGYFSAALAAAPTDLRSLERRSRAYSVLGSAEAALADADAAIRLRSDAALLRWRSGLRTTLGDVAGALADLGEMLRLNRDDAEAWMERARLHASRQDWGAAVADAGEAIRRRPDDIDAVYWRGTWHHAAGSLEEADRDYSAVLQKMPDFVGAVANRGWVRLRLKRPVEAVQDFNRAIAKAPDAFSHLWRGAARLQTRDFGGAQSDFTKALEFDPRNTEALLNRAAIREWVGVWLAASGNREDAVHWWHAALADFERVEEIGEGIFDAEELEERIQGVKEKLKGP